MPGRCADITAPRFRGCSLRRRCVQNGALTAPGGIEVRAITAPPLPTPLPTAATHNYKEMKDLSKDAVNRLAVDEAGAGQRVDNFLMRMLKGSVEAKVHEKLAQLL